MTKWLWYFLKTSSSGPNFTGFRATFPDKLGECRICCDQPQRWTQECMMSESFESLSASIFRSRSPSEACQTRPVNFVNTDSFQRMSLLFCKDIQPQTPPRFQQSFRLIFGDVTQNVLCRSKFFVTDQKFIYILYQFINTLCQTKRWFAFSKIGFCAGTKVFEEALNAVKFLGWLKKFGPAQNILGPVKGQGISSK